MWGLEMANATGYGAKDHNGDHHHASGVGRLWSAVKKWMFADPRFDQRMFRLIIVAVAIVTPLGATAILFA